MIYCLKKLCTRSEEEEGKEEQKNPVRDKKKGKSPNSKHKLEANEKIFKHFESYRVVANRERTKEDGTL